jgi:hypothetical protein
MIGYETRLCTALAKTLTAAADTAELLAAADVEPQLSALRRLLADGDWGEAIDDLLKLVAMMKAACARPPLSEERGTARESEAAI